MGAGVSAPRAFALLGAVLALALAAAGWAVGWSNLWASPDQRGRFLFERGRFKEAAQALADPIWRGAAQYRAGDFKGAEASFSGVDSAQATYDQGDALVMLGKYSDAVARYDHALELRPGWREAQANRRIAQLRAERLKAPGGDLGDQGEGADAIVYDKDAKREGGQETQVEGAQAMDDAAARALWLKRVQTKPADFLRSRFAWQLEARQPASAGEGAR